MYILIQHQKERYPIQKLQDQIQKSMQNPVNPTSNIAIPIGIFNTISIKTAAKAIPPLIIGSISIYISFSFVVVSDKAFINQTTIASTLNHIPNEEIK